ncbi:hypothetical protein F4775DRAFT_569356 [Biscogniauxia sp. FL1348]|nr:hypothetical protein F4775DRAFT_569356 [Biscogniauxia sp. FL1348]
MVGVVDDQQQPENMTSARNTANPAQNVSTNRPPSATTSQMSITGNRDYGMKFVGGIEEIISNPSGSYHSQPSGTAPITTPPETVTLHEPPPYWERPRESAESQKEEDENDECHPFWVSWWDIIRGIGLIIAGCLSIPLVVVHGMSKMFYYIPVLYKDESIRKWPEITGFGSGCIAGVEWGFWFVLVNPLTDWLILPYKGAKKNGVLGFFTGFLKGLCNIMFKPVSGAAGFIGHPLFGIYKEATEFKVEIKRQRRSRKRATSPV